MKKTTRNIIISLAVLLVLGAAAAVLILTNPSAVETEESSSSTSSESMDKIIDKEIADVESVAIENAESGETITLVPTKSSADSEENDTFTIEGWEDEEVLTSDALSLAQAFYSITPTKELGTVENLAEYGLDGDGAYKATVTGTDGSTETVVVGSEAGETYGWYILYNDTVYIAPLSTNLYQGKYYGLPLDTNCKAAVMNMNVLAELGLDAVPETMEELIEAASGRGTYTINVSGVGDWDMYPYFWLFGGVLTNDDFTQATGYLDSAESIAAMEKIAELHDAGIFTIRDVDGSVDAWDGINSEYAMFLEGPWYFGSYEDSEAKGIVAATVPTYNGKSASVVGGENVAVFSTSEHPDAAYEFAKFLTSTEAQLALLQAGQLPILKSLVDSDEVQSNPVWSVYMAQMESAKARIPSPNNSNIQQIWSDMVTNIFVNGADIAAELQNAAALIDEQLA